MNKILYHPKPGTTGFFYGEFPDEPERADFDFYSDDYHYAMQHYNKLFHKCKEEAIKNGEIVNPKLLPVTFYHNSQLNLGTMMLNDPYKELKDGDIFDLPKGLKVEKNEYATVKHDTLWIYAGHTFEVESVYTESNQHRTESGRGLRLNLRGTHFEKERGYKTTVIFEKDLLLKTVIRLVPSDKEEKEITSACPLPNECCSPNCNCVKEEKESVKQK